MQELYYTALDIAAIVNSMEMGMKAEAKLLDQLWKFDRSLFLPKYYDNQRKLILDVHYWTDYLHDKPIIDAEYPAIQKEFLAIGSKMTMDVLINDFSDLDLFLKSLRIKILYLDGKGYSRVKLRSLLRQYGYKRRSKKLMQYIRECCDFYHIKTYLRGGIAFNVEMIGIDEMITFRVI